MTAPSYAADGGRVQLSSLQIGKRHRTLSRAKVTALAESIKAIGLHQPISVYAGKNNVANLVAGLHRVEAAKRLGWEHIACVYVELDEVDRELWEIDENLMRAELTTDEKRAHLKRRKALWEKRGKSVVAHDAPKLTSKTGRVGEGRPKCFAADTAARPASPNPRSIG
jgi:ParB/RepB/Spo0J family partition protein